LSLILRKQPTDTILTKNPKFTSRERIHQVKNQFIQKRAVIVISCVLLVLCVLFFLVRCCLIYFLFGCFVIVFFYYYYYFPCITPIIVTTYCFLFVSSYPCSLLLYGCQRQPVAAELSIVLSPELRLFWKSKNSSVFSNTPTQPSNFITCPEK